MRSLSETEQSLYSRSILCGDLSFMSIPGIEKGRSLRCLVKIRCHHKAQDAVIEKFGEDQVMVSFTAPARAAAPGQSAVFYDKNDCVIGGGTIRKVL